MPKKVFHQAKEEQDYYLKEVNAYEMKKSEDNGKQRSSHRIAEKLCSGFEKKRELYGDNKAFFSPKR